MTEILEMFSSVLGDFDLTQITEILSTLVEYISNLISSLM